MLRRLSWVIWGMLLVTPAVKAQTPSPEAPAPAVKSVPAHKPRGGAAATTSRKRTKKTAKTPKPAALPALPGGPLRQLPMDQIPSTPATVTYQGGMLSISAKNSPLSDILREIRKLTGAAIEIPPQNSGSDERVITHLGPGTPRDVLVSLLNGSSYNYVMLGSSSDPNMISSIILTSKTSGQGDTQAAVNVVPMNPPPGVVMPPHPIPAPQPFNPQMGRQGPAGNGETPDESSTEEAQQDNSADENTNAEDQAQQQQQEQPGQVDLNGGQQPQDPNQPNAGPKTPEQILEMLRRQQQQPPQPQPPQQQ